ncbi:hypothetical protein [Paenibacillus luteus]|uniref:hypothetical protein n=1 Tax=Paenibacillus luteus TaxID=2545753 RepID=UPI0013759B60|nr:hypothetical protein [Paenibacillus luteus]
MKVSREEFDGEFQKVNASWGYENKEVDKKGKELIYKRLNNEITEEEFSEAVKKLIDE